MDSWDSNLFRSGFVDLDSGILISPSKRPKYEHFPSVHSQGFQEIYLFLISKAYSIFQMKYIAFHYKPIQKLVQGCQVKIWSLVLLFPSKWDSDSGSDSNLCSNSDSRFESLKNRIFDKLSNEHCQCIEENQNKSFLHNPSTFKSSLVHVWLRLE